MHTVTHVRRFLHPGVQRLVDRVAPLAGATPAVGQPAANNNAGVVWLY